MKHLYRQLLIAVFFLTSFTLSAQKHHAYADFGLVFNGPNPGVSATYNYKLAKHLGAGIGIQGYGFSPTEIDAQRFIPAVYADVRLNIRPGKKNQFASFLDIGMNFFQSNQQYYRTSPYDVFRNKHNNGMYLGLGIAYLRRISPRGSGPYLSLKMISNSYTTNRYDPITLQQMAVWYNLSANFAASLGFRF